METLIKQKPSMKEALIFMSIAILIMLFITYTDEGRHELRWSIDGLISILVFGSLIFLFQFVSLWLFFKHKKGLQRVLYASLAGICSFILFMFIYGWMIGLVRGFA